MTMIFNPSITKPRFILSHRKPLFIDGVRKMVVISEAHTHDTTRLSILGIPIEKLYPFSI